MYSLQQHLAFNFWANGKFVEILKTVDENIFELEVNSSFPSLRKTVLHIWDAEYIWLKRIEGLSLSEFPSKNFTGNKEECLNGFLEHTKKVADFMEGKDKAYFESKIDFKALNGDAFSESVEGIIYHVVNHGTFHRGQMVTMMRTLGITAVPSTDLIRYLRQLN
ncbi:MAG: DNA polymerase [Bacteroidetes bacterium]|nr:DNA polymerase [Bacteroidota bacterium]